MPDIAFFACFAALRFLHGLPDILLRYAVRLGARKTRSHTFPAIMVSSRCFAFLLLLLALPASLVALAETREYEVEVVIFEEARGAYVNSEQWDVRLTPANGDAGLSTAAVAPPALPAQVRQGEPALLREDARRIVHSSYYHALYYAAWRQPGLDKDKAFAIDLNALRNHITPQGQNHISGTLKVVLGRYLHFYTRLDYQRRQMASLTALQASQGVPGGATRIAQGGSMEASASRDEASAAPEVAVIAHYPIVSHRRMRSKELHYIDHPLVGILVQINPVKKKPAEAAENQLNAPASGAQRPSAGPAHH